MERSKEPGFSAQSQARLGVHLRSLDGSLMGHALLVGGIPEAGVSSKGISTGLGVEVTKSLVLSAAISPMRYTSSDERATRFDYSLGIDFDLIKKTSLFGEASFSTIGGQTRLLSGLGLPESAQTVGAEFSVTDQLYLGAALMHRHLFFNEGDSYHGEVFSGYDFNEEWSGEASVFTYPSVRLAVTRKF